MLQFRNETPFVGAITLFPDADGIDTVCAILKGTFTLAPTPSVADEQIPVTTAAEYFGEPEASSVKRPTDVSLPKPATDIVVIGHAVAPNGYVSVMDVSVAVGPVRKTARVFGDRVWQSNGATYSISTPSRFESIPLVWERAFGGTDRTERGPREEARNPIGTGFRTTDGLAPLEGLFLPNIEDPLDLISSWKQTPAPMGFGPLGAHWEPRRSYAGTYDEQWQETRAPYLPSDFDPRFLQIAPADLIARGYLQGGEPVELRGLSQRQVIAFQLPTVRPRIAFRLDGKPNDRPAYLDTVVLEPTDGRLSLVWRASFPCDKKSLRVNEVVATLASPG